MKIFWVILVIVIVLILAGGSYWFLKSKATDQTTTPAKQGSNVKTPQSTQTVKAYLVAIGDAGKSGKKIGCDDSLVAVDRTVPATQAVLKASIEELLSIKTQDYGESGLYNALYQSDLEVVSASIENEKATIKLSGKIVSGGACDNPRIEEQLKATALQFSTVKEVKIFVNDKTLEEVLSSK